ncbi:Flp family type IVb pilin [Rhodoplanes sp. Z2-YC6860]|uniref:Flp family type IVb pilin n=1 Tax=Rhodoplanes sp. Z2-YC6860 TaxID=674703 RepID=UPI0009FD2EB8|nr:Flp family type IVb pilin [Rhodoplanes sp. Z2-YC6860]
MTTELTRFLRDESGTAAIEYGLIAASISIATITAVQSFGSKLKIVFTAAQAALN